MPRRNKQYTTRMKNALRMNTIRRLNGWGTTNVIMKNTPSSGHDESISQETSNMKTCPESLPGGLKYQQNDDDDGDAWLSCQTDINKLVQPSNFIDVSSVCPEESVLPEDTCDIAETKDVLFTLPIDIIDEEFKPEINCIDTIIENDISDNTYRPLPIISGRIYPIESSDDWVINKSLCRCCHAEGTFTGLQEKSQGENVTYDNMLRTCLNLQLFPVTGAMSMALCALCSLCAARLRDAHAFVRQVRACEARFQNLYLQNCVKVAGIIQVKEESPGANEVAGIIQVKEELPGSSEDSDFGMDLTEDSSNQLLLVKRQVTVEMAPKQKNYKNTPTKIRKKPAPKKKPPLKHVKIAPMKVTPEQKNNKNTASDSEQTAPEGNNLLKQALQSAQRTIPTPLPHTLYTQTGGSYKCNRCEKLWRSSTEVISHFRRVHLKLHTFKCVHCIMSFKTHTKLMIHKIEEHNIDDRLKCNACDKTFYRKAPLTFHMNTYHMMGERIKCSMCDFECYDKSILKKHLFKHKTSKDYHCQYCKKSFLRTTNLRLHEKIHTGVRDKVCAECGQAFVQKASLNYHMAKYHPEVKF